MKRKQSKKEGRESLLFIVVIIILLGFTSALFEETGFIKVKRNQQTTSFLGKLFGAGGITGAAGFTITQSGNESFKPGFNITYVNGTCSSGSTDIMHVQNYNNSHAELANQSNYDIRVCAKDDLGTNTITNSSGFTFLKLFDVTNSHAQYPNETGYNYSLVMNGSIDAISCTYTNSSGVCPEPGNQTCVATMYDTTNSHITTCTDPVPYDLTLCCGFVATETTIGNITTTFTNGTCPLNTTDVLHLSSENNSHVELPTQSNYDFRVCVGDTTGRNNITNSSGFNLIDLSNETNAHAELPDETNYTFEAFINGTQDTISCSYPQTYGVCSQTDEVCLFTVSTNLSSGFTNLHASSCTNQPYQTSVCCGFGAASLNSYFAPADSFTGNLSAQGSINSTITNNTAYTTDQFIMYKNGSQNYLQLRALFSSAAVDATNLIIEENGTAISINRSAVTGIGSTHTLFLNNTNTNNGVFICPDANSLTQAISSCSGRINVSGPNSGTLTNGILVTLDGSQYKIEGLTGSAVVLGTFANLVISDDTDTLSIKPNQSIVFRADYQDSNAVDITGANCNISFHDATSQIMTYNATQSLYTANRSYAVNGTFNWNVTCAKTGYDTLFANDTVFVSPSNTAPNTTQPDIQPDPAFTANDLNITITYTDPEGANGTVFANWTVQSVLVRSVNYTAQNNSQMSDTLVSTNFNTNDTVVVYVWAVDNESSSSQILNDSLIITDNTAPNSSITTPRNSEAIGSNSIPYNITGAAVDDLALKNVEVSINGTQVNATGTALWSYMWAPGAGVFTLFSQAVDTYSNNETNFEFVNVSVFPTSIIFNSNATGSSTIENSTVDSSSVENSDVTFSNVNGSVIDPSTVENSNITNSTITDSTINFSTVIDSTTTNCLINRSVLNSSTCTGSTTHNSTTINSTYLTGTVVLDALIINDQCISGTIIYNGQTTTCPVSLSTVYNPPAPPAASVVAPSGGGGGGGGGTGSGCEPQWRCTDWGECNANGVQTRSCVDIFDCVSKVPANAIFGPAKPDEKRSCALTSEIEEVSVSPEQPLVEEERRPGPGLPTFNFLTFLKKTWPIVMGTVLFVIVLFGAMALSRRTTQPKPLSVAAVVKELQTFIDAAAHEGYTREQIKGILKHIGWPSSVINSYVDHYFPEKEIQIKKKQLQIRRNKMNIQDQLEEIDQKLKELGR